MQYYIAKLSHDNGKTYLKTVAKDDETAIQNIMAAEHCPKSAIEIKNVGKELYSMRAKLVFNKVKN